jgi:hypothetical protein
MAHLGALPIDPAVAEPPAVILPRASTCVFDLDNTPTLPTLDVAPCGDAATATGTGIADRPWRTLWQALAAAIAGDVIHVHDSSAAVDYTKFDLTPARPGNTQARIRLVGAPGVGAPTVAKPSDATVAKLVLRLTEAWWIVDGLQVLGTYVERSAAILAMGSNLVISRLAVTQAGNAASGTSGTRIPGTRWFIRASFVVLSTVDTMARGTRRGVPSSSGGMPRCTAGRARWSAS